MSAPPNPKQLAIEAVEKLYEQADSASTYPNVILWPTTEMVVSTALDAVQKAADARAGDYLARIAGPDGTIDVRDGLTRQMIALGVIAQVFDPVAQ